MVLRLEPRSGASGYETVVRAPTSRQDIHLEAEELTRTPGTLGDPFRAVESLPGVTAVAWPAPIYAVRGANPGNTGFLLDDLRVPALFHLALHMHAMATTGLLVDPCVTHDWLLAALDVARYPLKRRTVDEPVLRFRR